MTLARFLVLTMSITMSLTQQWSEVGNVSVSSELIMMQTGMTRTPVSDRIIKWIMNGSDLNAWFEKNKREFIKKHNPKYYETLYDNKNNQKEGEGN